jgi:hypothetical protein
MLEVDFLLKLELLKLPSVGEAGIEDLLHILAFLEKYAHVRFKTRNDKGLERSFSS